MLGNRKNSKTGRLDIRAKFNDGEDCNIELQVEPYPYMTKECQNICNICMMLKIVTDNQKTFF